MQKLNNLAQLERECQTNAYIQANSESIPSTLPKFNPSKNTLKFIPNSNFAEELVNSIPSRTIIVKPDLTKKVVNIQTSGEIGGIYGR
jgi:hypothetical protein